MLKRTAIAAALTAVLAMPAFAQQQNSPPGANGFVQGQSAGDWRGSKLIGASVYGPDNASIGEISDTRGLKKVGGEAALSVLAYNLIRAINLIGATTLCASLA